MAMIDIGGIRLHVQRVPPKGRRPAVATAVLVHGMLTDSLASYYFTLAPSFAQSGINVLMYDLRGHGRSERPDSGYTLDYNLNDLDALLDRLDVTGPVHLVGNSYGGTVAFSYAVRRPERVASLSVIESSPATPEWAANLGVGMRQWTARMEKDESAVLAWITANRGHHKARQAKRAARLVQATTIVRDIPASRVLTEEQIRSVRCPALFIYGGESSLVEQSPWLESLLPDYRSVVVPGHEHSVLVEAPQAVGAHILSLIHEVAEAGTPGTAPGPDAP
jgi:pimeloyl-ACP methyl ester carboxylesterase